MIDISFYIYESYKSLFSGILGFNIIPCNIIDSFLHSLAIQVLYKLFLVLLYWNNHIIILWTTFVIVSLSLAFAAFLLFIHLHSNKRSQEVLVWVSKKTNVFLPTCFPLESQYISGFERSIVLSYFTALIYHIYQI